MKWKQKALLQNLVARLPLSLSYSLHYYLQRKAGSIGTVDLTRRLRTGLDLAECIVSQGRSVESGVFLELGTGLQVALPLVLWLLGASEITTVDLHRYLRPELVGDDVRRMRQEFEEIKVLLGKTPGTHFSTDRLTALLGAGDELERLLEIAHINYQAPVDAINPQIGSHTIDYHVSYSVFQHIPPESLKVVVSQARRVLKPGGLFVHWIDLSDHYSHMDSSISAVNFLRFSEREWMKLAGNMYMYQNRLRIDDYVHLINDEGGKVLKLIDHVNERSLELLQKGFPLDARFANKDARTNATSNAWLICAFT
jgi:SAM-dependent methyltransferase